MPALHKNRVKMTVTGTPGTGTVTLNAASSGHQSFATAYGANATVDVLFEDGTAWEVCRNCTYTHSGTTVTRGTLEESSTGSAISLTSAATVSVVATAGRENERIVGPYASTTALETAYPAASYGGASGIVGSSAPYSLYWSDGNAWILSASRANPLVTIASSGASFTQSAINASVIDVTLTGNCTIAFSNVPTGAYTVRLILRQDGTGSRTVTWPSGITWDGSGSAPTLRTTASTYDDIELTTVNGGTNWIGRNLRAQQSANPASYGLVHIENNGSTTQSLTGSASTKIAAALTTVVTNADSWWDTTNKKFLPTVAGKYLITVGVQGGNTSASLVAQVYKNGAIDSNGAGSPTGTYSSVFNTQVVTLNGTTDYIEAYCYSSATLNTNAAADNTYFKALFLGA